VTFSVLGDGPEIIGPARARQGGKSLTRRGFYAAGFTLLCRIAEAG
jgi:hypothetical protein